MQDPRKLLVLEQARKVIRLTYRTTASFPRAEKFGLVDQMRRASVSIGSSIAEGCGRSTNPSFRKSLDDAMSEASELQFQCWVAGDLEFGKPDELQLLTAEVERGKRMLAKLIVAVRNRPRKQKGNS